VLEETKAVVVEIMAKRVREITSQEVKGEKIGKGTSWVSFLDFK